MNKMVILDAPIEVGFAKGVMMVVAVAIFYLIKGLIKKLFSKEVVLTEELLEERALGGEWMVSRWK